MQIEEITESQKGKRKVMLADGTAWVLYTGEIRSLGLKSGMELTEDLYQKIQVEILEKRAVKRAMHLLEKMDMTEKKLRDKLSQNEYPQTAIERAVDYVKGFHYIDDLRYAESYIRSYQGKKSKRRITADLLTRGVSKAYIEQAFESEYETDEQQMIQQLLLKKGYNAATADAAEQRKVYAFLMRRGFQSADVLHAMKCSDYLT